MSQRLQNLQADIDATRRAGDAERLRVLKFLLSKVERIVKEGPDRPATDNDVIQAVSRYLKEVDETRLSFEKAGRPTDEQEREIAIVSAYLPKQMTDDELDAEIEKALEGVVRDRKAMGVVMKHLNGGFKGMFDPKNANALTTAKLS